MTRFKHASMVHAAILAAAMTLPGPVLAVGGDSGSPPTPTQTTNQCKQGKVWDSHTRKCVLPQSGALDDDTLYGAAREFAYAGQYDNALRVLAAMSDPDDDRVLTYKGFSYRRMGERELGLAYYRQAIARNPGNLLARSYMGQGLAEDGDMLAAREQLSEIRRRGGRNSWAEFALRMAIETGHGTSY